MNSKLNKQKASIAVIKAQGTVKKVLSMIEEDAYCPDIIQQLDAAIGLLNSSKKKLLTDHLGHCLDEKLKQNKQKSIEELIKIFDLK